MEATNDDKLLNTLGCLERQAMEQVGQKYKPYTTNLSTRFGVMFYDDKKIVPRNLRNTAIMLLHKGHPLISKMTHAAKPFWWPKVEIQQEIQQICNDCIPCKMTGKSVKPRFPLTEVNYVPLTKKSNQDFQLGYVGPKNFEQRQFFILVSIDRYSRWQAACFCETPTGKTTKCFLEQNITPNHCSIPQTIRTDKSTAFTGKEFTEFCTNINIMLLYGNTVYIYTNRSGGKRN